MIGVMHIKKSVFHPITANNASFLSSKIAVGESFEPLIKIEGQHPRIFAKPIYHQQKIPNSLQVIMYVKVSMSDYKKRFRYCQKYIV